MIKERNKAECPIGYHKEHGDDLCYKIDIAKHDPRVIGIKDRIDAEYEAERVSAISDTEMFGWIEEVFGDQLPALR